MASDKVQTTESLNTLRQLVNSKKYETNFPIDDKFLLKFLRVSKYDAEKASERINCYVEGRTKYATEYENMNPEVVKLVYGSKVVQLLPNDTTEGRSIFYMNFNSDPKIVSSYQILLATVCVLERLLDEPKYQLVGQILICNCENFTWRHAIQWTPSIVAKLIKIVLRMLPFRIHEIHYVNEMPAIRFLINNFVYPFLSDKIRKRIHLHGSNLDSLHEHVDPSLLPQDLGGTGPEMDLAYIMTKYFPDYHCQSDTS